MPVLITDKDTIFVTSGSFDTSVTSSGAVTGRTNLTTQYRMTFVNSAGVITESTKILTNAAGEFGVGAAPNAGRQFLLESVSTTAAMQMRNSGTTGTGGSSGFEILVINNDNYIINRENGFMQFRTSNADAMQLTANGELLINTTTAGASKLRVNDDSFEIMTAKTPATAGATGTTGQIAWDSSYFYVCVATNTWQRVAHATW